MKKYRVAHIVGEIFDFFCGGISVISNALYKNKKDDECFIFCKYWNEETIEGHEIAKDVYCFSLNFLINLKKLPFLIEENIFVHNQNLMCLPNLQTQAKKIMVLHGLDVDKNILINSYINCDELVGISQSNVDKMENIFLSSFIYEKSNHNLLKKSSVIYNGISLSNLNFDLLSNKKIGFVGRYHNIKGLFLLVKSIQHINDYKLYIAGSETEQLKNDTLIKLYTAFNLLKTKNFFPIGHISGHRKECFFNSMEAIVIPSFNEGLSLVLLEAMNFGKIVFANKIDGILEVLGDNYPFYFDPLDEYGLKKLIQKYEKMPKEEKMKIIMENHKKIKEKFSIDKMIQKYRTYETDSFYKYVQYGINLI